MTPDTQRIRIGNDLGPAVLTGSSDRPSSPCPGFVPRLSVLPPAYSSGQESPTYLQGCRQVPTCKTRPRWPVFCFADIRKRERKFLEKAGFVQSGNSALAPIASTIAIVSTFTCHILLRRKLTAPVVRTSRAGLCASQFWQVPGGQLLPTFAWSGIRPPHPSGPGCTQTFKHERVATVGEPCGDSHGLLRGWGRN